MTTTYEIGPLLGGLSLLSVSLLWYVAWNVRELGHRWLDQRESTAPGGEDDEVKVPDDLSALAMGESAEWAQQQTLKVIRERYTQLGDWNMVRSAMGVAHKDEE